MEEPPEEETPRKVGCHRKGLANKGNATEGDIAKKSNPQTQEYAQDHRKIVHLHVGWDIGLAGGCHRKGHGQERVMPQDWACIKRGMSQQRGAPARGPIRRGFLQDGKAHRRGGWHTKGVFLKENAQKG